MTSRTDLNGLAKRVFGSLNELVPSWAMLQQMIPFEQKAKIGAEYEELVVLRRPHGITPARTTAGTVYNLNAARAMISAPARTSGSEIVMRDVVPYGLAAAAMNAGERAYKSALGEILMSLLESHRFYIEAIGLYGRSTDGIARIESVSGSGTTRAWIISKPHWAPGLWMQSEGAGLDVFVNSGSTQRNTNAVVDVVSVDADLRTVNVSGNATDLTAVVAGDMIVFRQQDTEVTNGIDSIIRNTGSIFGISAATYGLWKGTTHDCGAQPLTLSQAHAAITKGAVKGSLGEMECLMSTYSWADLIDDQSALRRFADREKGDFVQGGEGLVFYGSNGGKLTFKPHAMVKAGEAFCLIPDDWIRGGESDVTEKTPGAGNDDFFHELQGQSGFEVRNFSSQFWMCKKPAKQIKIYNILPRGLS